MKIDLNEIHDCSGWHEESILKSEICGCFYCLSIFPPHEIEEWVQEQDTCPRGPGKTAICPKCGIDSVLPDNIGEKITKELLEAMQREFF